MLHTIFLLLQEVFMFVSYRRIYWQIMRSCASLKPMLPIEFLDGELNVSGVFDTNKTVSGLLWLWIMIYSFWRLPKCRNCPWQLTYKTSCFHVCGTLLSLIDAFSVKKKSSSWLKSCCCSLLVSSGKHSTTAWQVNMACAAHKVCRKWPVWFCSLVHNCYTSCCRTQDESSTWKSVTAGLHDKHSCSSEKLCGLQPILIIENDEWWVEVSVIYCISIVSCHKWCTELFWSPIGILHICT